MKLQELMQYTHPDAVLHGMVMNMAKTIDELEEQIADLTETVWEQEHALAYIGERCRLLKGESAGQLFINFPLNIWEDNSHFNQIKKALHLPDEPEKEEK